MNAKRLYIIIVAALLIVSAGATTPQGIASGPIDSVFERFQTTVPVQCERLLKELRRRVPQPKDEWLREMVKGMEACQTAITNENIPNLKRAFAAKRDLADMLDEFERLTMNVDDLRWSIDEFVALAVSKKLMELDEELQNSLSSFWISARAYNTRFGWELRQEIKRKK